MLEIRVPQLTAVLADPDGRIWSRLSLLATYPRQISPEPTATIPFGEGLLDWPQYTRPEVFRKKQVPKELLSGNHKNIATWRQRHRNKQ